MTLVRKNFNEPDESHNPPFMKADTIKMGEMVVVRQIYQPGWRWSKHIKPLVKTESCQVHHFGIMISGRLGTKANDGQEIEYGPGDVADIPPGHDGWVIGDEPVVFYSITCGSVQKM